MSGNVQEVPPPYQACSGCEKGDTPTGLTFIGPAGAHVEILSRLGQTRDEAIRSLNLTLNDAEIPIPDIESDLDAGTLQVRYRVCRGCALRIRCEVASLDSDYLPSYRLRPNGAAPERAA